MTSDFLATRLRVPPPLTHFDRPTTIAHGGAIRLVFPPKATSSHPSPRRLRESESAAAAPFRRTLYPQGRRGARPRLRPRRPCGCNRGGRTRFAAGRFRLAHGD